MPDALLPLVTLSLIAAGTLAVILVRRRGTGSDLVPPDLATRPPAPGSRPGPLPTGTAGQDPVAGQDALVAEVQALLRAGRMIQAVKVMRERTGLSLAEAKAAVDEVDRSGQLPARLGPPSAADRLAAQPDLYEQLRHLKQRGRTIEAIKLLRSRTGASLRDAKHTVDRL